MKSIRQFLTFLADVRSNYGRLTYLAVVAATVTWPSYFLLQFLKNLLEVLA